MSFPYFGYARQDRKDEPRVPISAKVMIDIIAAAEQIELSQRIYIQRKFKDFQAFRLIIYMEALY